MTITVESLADEMFALVSLYAGKRNLKAGDLTKEMIAHHSDCTKDDCKLAIRILIESQRCVYSYVGGSYIVLPPKAGE
jgi:hypothetical protein